MLKKINGKKTMNSGTKHEHYNLTAFTYDLDKCSVTLKFYNEHEATRFILKLQNSGGFTEACCLVAKSAKK